MRRMNTTGCGSPRADVRVVVLIVDAARAGDLVVHGATEARGERPSEESFEDGGGPNRRHLTGCDGDVVVELLRGREADTFR
jgi:hypothetical protein